LPRGGRGGDAARAAGGRALEPRHARHDAIDRVALENLVLEQLLREGIELLAVGDDHLLRRAAGLLDQRLALPVADAQRRLRQAPVTVWRAALRGGAPPLRVGAAM